MKVIFIVPYPEHQAPSQRLKFEQYYVHFRAAGITVVHDPFMSDAFWNIVYKKGHFFRKFGYVIQGYARRFKRLFSLREYDIVYTHLWITPFGFPLFEWLYRKCSRKMIYDIDDLVYLTDAKSRANALVNVFKGRRKPIFLMKKADHVITCTPYLDQFVRRFNPYTTDISSTIDTDRYRPRTSYEFQDGKLVLGWSGSHSTSPYLQLLYPVFCRLKENRIPFKLLVMGDARFKLEGMEVEALPWKGSYETEVIARFDIGLYPLPEEEWVYGKSGLKALQYMAMGVPTIATAIGTNFRIIENGVSGYLVNSEEQWFQRILELAKDAELRKRIGKKGAENVEEHYSIHRTKEFYLSVLKGGN